MAKLDFSCLKFLCTLGDILSVLGISASAIRMASKFSVFPSHGVYPHHLWTSLSLVEAVLGGCPGKGKWLIGISTSCTALKHGSALRRTFGCQILSADIARNASLFPVSFFSLEILSVSMVFSCIGLTFPF